MKKYFLMILIFLPTLAFSQYRSAIGVSLSTASFSSFESDTVAKKSLYSLSYSKVSRKFLASDVDFSFGKDFYKLSYDLGWHMLTFYPLDVYIALGASYGLTNVYNNDEKLRSLFGVDAVAGLNCTLHPFSFFVNAKFDYTFSLLDAGAGYDFIKQVGVRYCF